MVSWVYPPDLFLGSVSCLVLQAVWWMGRMWCGFLQELYEGITIWWMGDQTIRSDVELQVHMRTVSFFYLKLLRQWLLYFFVLLFRLWTLESSAVLSAEPKMRFSVLSFSLVCSLLKVAISVQVQVVSHCAEQLPFHALVDIDTKITV